MLRASVEFEGGSADLSGIVKGAKAGDAGVAHGALLTAFADAAVQGDAAHLATARDALRAAAGSAALVDAAGVVGNFERMVRIADASGIPLDGMISALSEDFREDLGLDAYATRRMPGRGAGPFAPLLRGVARAGLKLAGKLKRR